RSAVRQLPHGAATWANLPHNLFRLDEGLRIRGKGLTQLQLSTTSNDCTFFVPPVAGPGEQHGELPWPRNFLRVPISIICGGKRKRSCPRCKRAIPRRWRRSSLICPRRTG